MRKKWAVFTTTVMLLASVIIGCSKDESAGSSGNSQEAVIRVWGADDFLKGDDSPGQKTIKEFNEKYKGKIRVEGKYMPWTEFNTAIQAGVTSNDLPDIFRTPQNTDLRTIVANGWIRPLDGIVSEQWKKQFSANAFMEGMNVLGGKTYTWPLFGHQLNYILYYNKDVMQKAGLDPEKPPKTWDELRQMAKTVTSKGKGDVYGLVFGGKDKVTSRIVQGFAGGISPEDANGFNYRTGKYTYDSKSIIDSFKYLLALKADGSILPASYTMMATEAGVLFGEAKAAFMIEARFKMWHIKRDTPNAKFGLAQVPTQNGSKPLYYDISSNLGGYMVSAKTKHPEAAGTFIEQAFASPVFYEKFIQSAVAVSPLEELNKKKSLYPYPEYETFVNLHKDLVRERPDFAIRNPETAQVITEMGAFSQPNIKPSFDEILLSILTGGKPEKDVESLLKDYNDKMNKGLLDTIEKVKKSGAKVSPSDFVFPNWDSTKDYTLKDYESLGR